MSGWIETPDKHLNPGGSVNWNGLGATARDRIVTSFHDFCIFMRDLWVANDAILVPPGGGWSSITTELFAKLNKNEKVVDILKHMTYVRNGGNESRYEILPLTALVDWRAGWFLKHLEEDDPEYVRVLSEDSEIPLPGDVIGISTGGKYCNVLLLDCRFGIVYWVECPEGKTVFGQAGEEGPEDEEDSNWRDRSAWPVEEFFEYVKEKFRTMEQLPRNDKRISSQEDRAERLEELREIYKNHGWPGEDFKKEECASAVKKLSIN